MIAANLPAHSLAVADFLSSSAPKEWKRHLETTYNGYMLAQRELGYSPSICDTYFCSESW